jgi:hypothetical protein
MYLDQWLNVGIMETQFPTGTKPRQNAEYNVAFQWVTNITTK